MPPASDRASTVSSLSLPGRRLLTRITSPFASKTRHVQDYHITVDDPHKEHSPGDQVTGAVHLTLNKPIRMTHLVVCLHGFVQVYKNPGTPPGDGYRSNNTHVGTGRSKSGEYFGNGFASLFEDEVILCGDGKLDEGEYQFQFVLEFPHRNLPSSLSFERGTISYMITATLTRPTAISPTIQCDHKVKFTELIDISQLLPPKARTITLEPISRRSRARHHARRLVETDRRSRKTESILSQHNTSHRNSEASSSLSLQAVGGDQFESAAPSEVSSDSHTGSQVPASHPGSNLTASRSIDTAKYNGSKVSLATKTITAEVESLAGGCLRGDNISIRIRVDHTKHVRSLHGVIITLYRHARVDLHPAIPLGPTEKGKESRYEDYYPRSITGLGGLSLSGAGSSHTFRKDMGQTIVPFIVDPTTLKAEVTGKVHVPEEAFPTISTVPGAMISFKYYVEVVIDIQGKLSTHDRNLGNLGGLASTMNSGPVDTNNAERSMFSPYGSPTIDTAAVRRDKGVVACTFEVIVGTKDGGRRKGKGKADDESKTLEHSQQQNWGAGESHGDCGYAQRQSYHNNHWYDTDQGYYDDQQYYNGSPYAQEGYPVQGHYFGEDHYSRVAHRDAPHELLQVPMPQAEDESGLPEKERMRRAEARLLPSQPPGSDEQTVQEAQRPTAPYLPEEQYGESTSSTFAHSSSPVAAGSSQAAVGMATSEAYSVCSRLPATPRYEFEEASLAYPEQGTSQVPAYEPPEIGRLHQASSTNLTDIKQEMSQRLSQMGSAPPEDGAEDLARVTSRPRPSAPILTEEDELYIGSHDSHADASASAELPRYER